MYTGRIDPWEGDSDSVIVDSILVIHMILMPLTFIFIFILLVSIYIFILLVTLTHR